MKNTESPFKDKKEATLTFAQWKKYLTDSYMRYVYHKKILADRGDPVVYKTRRKLEALDKCLHYVDVFPQWPLKTIAAKILKLHENLTIILPKGNNTSYQSQKNRLEEIIYVANNLTQNI